MPALVHAADLLNLTTYDRESWAPDTRPLIVCVCVCVCTCVCAWQRQSVYLMLCPVTVQGSLGPVSDDSPGRQLVECLVVNKVPNGDYKLFSCSMFGEQL